MQEKVLENKKNGMAFLVCVHSPLPGGDRRLYFRLLSDGSRLLCRSPYPSHRGRRLDAGGWIPFMGLKVLKPQEALVLTLFGRYVGTLKNDGFYFVNPFCSSMNPAAKTRLNQSGDVDGGAGKSILIAASQSSANVEIANKKISLKIMTLNNNRRRSTIVWQSRGDRHRRDVAGGGHGQGGF